MPLPCWGFDNDPIPCYTAADSQFRNEFRGARSRVEAMNQLGRSSSSSRLDFVPDRAHVS